MRPTFIIHALVLVLLTGCMVADDAARHLRLADEAIKAAQQSRKLGNTGKAAEQAEQAVEHARKAFPQARQSARGAQQSTEIRRALQIEDEAAFIVLEGRANNAVDETANKIKSSQGALTNADEAELEKFLNDFLCFHLETMANERRLPTDKDYQEFLVNYAITRFVPVWEIKEKADSIIKIAKNPPSTGAELEARKRILQECTLRRLGSGTR